MKIHLQKAAGKIFLFLTVCFLLFAGTASVHAASASVDHPQKAEDGRFVKDGTHWLYQYRDDSFAKNQCLLIDKKIYYFNKYGHRFYNFRTINGKDYYFGKSGEGYLYKDKIFSVKGSTYYASKDGTLKKSGWFTSRKGKTYCFGADGKAYTGKRRISGTIYYFDSNGVLLRRGLNFNLDSRCGLLINADTGKILFGKNENLAHANASTTKIMTCILALENCRLNEKVKVSANAAAQEPVKLYMRTGERFYLKDLLYSLMLPSHNDTAVAIAEHVSGSTEKFVKLMNQKAASLGCTNTHFATPNGLDAGYRHYTTASDLAKIASYASKNPTFCKIVATRTYSFSSINTKRHFTVSTTNGLLEWNPGIVGMKTGYTKKAGYCFVGLCRAKSGKTYISVVLGAPDSDTRWADSTKLLNYAYQH